MQPVSGCKMAALCTSVISCGFAPPLSGAGFFGREVEAAGGATEPRRNAL